MPAVEFQLDMDKVIASAVYVAQKVPRLTVGRLMKLLFLADKYHLVRYGRPITGDRYIAMKDGPVPSFAYRVFKKEVLKNPYTPQGKRLALAIAVDKTESPAHLSAKGSFDRTQLSASDVEALNRIIAAFGKLTFHELRKMTHAMPAYHNAWEVRGNRSGVRMNFADFFENDADAIPGVKEEVQENNYLRHAFAER